MKTNPLQENESRKCHLGVIGAGVMGTGVAQAALQWGYDVTLVDISERQIQQAEDRIREYEMLASLSGVARSEAAESGRLILSDSLAELSECTFVVENISEVIEAKLKIFSALSGHLDDHCIIAANTSAISITKLASCYRIPGNVVGIHFMNPVALKPTVELIRGYHSSPEAIAAARGFLADIAKHCVEIPDSPGFISNRVLMVTINEAISLVLEGVATAEQVDEVFRSCFGHPMGPLATADMIGLDTIKLSLLTLHEQFLDPKYRPSTLLGQMVDAGLLGRKSGKGFFEYAPTGAEVKD